MECESGVSEGFDGSRAEISGDIIWRGVLWSDRGVEVSEVGLLSVVDERSIENEVFGVPVPEVIMIGVGPSAGESDGRVDDRLL